ncbi:hypothetical protein PGTUg99_005026 [Puccinia graminis f. sp. tritici]|uniref:Choline transporter-like protein n=1 Tax=Puccinia graminis f. sp. tritici TaxID=56615 RepID=A0A5B0RBK7_PUCGR|nr:hypothetical protein PGTUg99_005026 [Puccinia graminis f. sp. tritici]
MSNREAHHQSGLQPLSQSFFNSHYQQQQQQQPSTSQQHQHQNEASNSYHHPTTNTGPSLSRFLSTSIINPIYRSRLFPSTVSENPLFYSTREGYENSLEDENDDILPDQDDHRLLQQLHSDRTRNPRGIDEGLEDDELSFEHHQSTSQGKQRGPSTSNTNLINSGPLDRLQNHFHQSHQQTEQEDDEDPFYEHQDLISSHHHPTLPEDRFEPPLPRHLMASHALSNLIASEISYGNHYIQSVQNHQTNYSDNPQNPVGWKMYQSLGPGSILAPPPPPPPPSLQKPPAAGPPSTSHNNSVPPSQPIPEPRMSPSELTERPPARQADRPVNSGFEGTPEAYPMAPNEYADGPPTVYIYPTEARDIGSDVSGQSSLGPQSYRDSFWIGAWLSSLLYAFGEALFVFFGSSGQPQSEEGDPRAGKMAGLAKGLPILALLITMTFGISVGSMSLLMLVKRSIRYLVYGAMVGVPSVLGMVGLWTWTEAVADSGRRGMGWVSVATVCTAGVWMRMMWVQRGRLERTIQVLTLAVSVLVAHPSLVMASVGLSMACILSSIPFLTLILNLLLRNGPAAQPTISSSAAIHALLAGFVWSWSLNVLRNLQRIIVAGVVSHWYFNRHSPPPTTKDQHRNGYSSLDSTCQSISRAIGPSLGTVCLASFLSTIFDSASKVFKLLHRLTTTSTNTSSSSTTPLRIFWGCANNLLLGWMKISIDFWNRIFDFMSSFTLIYAGITGFNFVASFRKTQALVFKQAQIGLFHNLLVKSILNLIALTISLTISLIGYQLYLTSLSSSSSSTIPSSSSKLLTAHTDLNDPVHHPHQQQQQAFGPFIWIFFGLLPFWILRFLTDLIATCVDTLFLCWNIDLDIGTNHSNLTRQAFIGKLDD